MNGRRGVLMGIVVAGAALALVVPVLGQQAATPQGPTKERPLRFSAFAVSMQAGAAGRVDIAIERWTTDAERQMLLKEITGTKFGAPGQEKFLRALQDVKPRTGYIRTTTSLGWDLKYAWERKLPDGTRQIVIATDKPVSFLAAARQARTMDYPFTFVEMRFGKDGKGEGRLLAGTAVSYAKGTLELENYGQEPVRLTSITQEK